MREITHPCPTAIVWKQLFCNQCTKVLGLRRCMLQENVVRAACDLMAPQFLDSSQTLSSTKVDHVGNFLSHCWMAEKQPDHKYGI